MGMNTRPEPPGEWPKASSVLFGRAGQKDHGLSGIGSCASIASKTFEITSCLIASKTAAITSRASIGSTKPHRRIALETISLSLVSAMLPILPLIRLLSQRHYRDHPDRKSVV